MKNNIKYLILISVLLLVQGCSLKSFIPNKLDQNSFTPVEERFQDLDKLQCGKLLNKNIFTNYTTKQRGSYKELYLFNSIEQIEYDGLYEKDFKYFVDNILQKYCASRIVTSKNQADVIIEGDIEKYYVQTVDIKKEDTKMDIVFKSILEIDTKIDNNQFLFGHVLNTKRHSNVEGALITIDSSLKYDDYQSSFAIFAATIKFGFSPEINGLIKTYDINGNELKKINLSTEDIGLFLNNEEKQDILNLYDVPGYLKLIMYRYIKDMIAYVNTNQEKE